ncbi:MAG: SGNH/GDSL hydrolase family protein [Pseudomonadota bacterium]
MLTDRAQQLLLSPVLAAQAVQVILRTPRLPEAAGPRSGETGQGPPLRLLILGDSSAAGVGAATQQDALSGQLAAALAPEVRVTWRVVAQTGLTTARIPAFLASSTQDRFDVAVTALGVNDTTRLRHPARWLRETQSLHAVLRADHGVRRIYVTAVPPLDRFPALPYPLNAVLGRQSRALMAVLEPALARVTDVQLLRPDWGLDPAKMAADGFHPGPEIYRRWGMFVAQNILQDLRSGVL